MDNVQPEQDDRITLRLGNGLPLKVEREVWRTEILPDNLKAAWDEPPVLANLIMDGFSQRMFREVLEAAKRLHEIDTDPLRGTALFSQSLIHNGAPDNAARILDEYEKQHGQAAVLLVNRAQIAAQKAGSEADPSVSELLWQALELEPNMENALYWYAGIAGRQGGEDAYVDALEKVAELPGAYMARVRLAEVDLRDEAKGSALLTLAEAIEAGKERPAESLLAVTGIMGRAGLAAEMLELALPVYELKQHGPNVGFNLLQAMVVTGQRAEAGRIMSEIAALNQPQLNGMLQRLAAQLQQRG
ncbi:hypothetical protein KDL44_01030 [bacterium]|nr:hypothetical protein [bacterium]